MPRQETPSFRSNTAISPENIPIPSQTSNRETLTILDTPTDHQTTPAVSPTIPIVQIQSLLQICQTNTKTGIL